ncbi:MAG: hypothetical protein IH626_01710 [Rhodospirillales bacterium]|nr:hypothetical protein [Rhodospirillales bacterium]
MSDVLDTLDRDELLQLVRDLVVGWRLPPSERDVVLARWQVASRRAVAAQKRVAATWEVVRPLAEAFDVGWRAWQGAVAAGNLPAADRAMRRFSRASDAYRAADANRKKLDARAERFRRRADRLWETLNAMPRGEPS